MESKIGIRERIEKALAINSKPFSKKFWKGYLTALANNDIIDSKEYQFLRDTIDLWKAGDRTSRMINPSSMSYKSG
jgi:hypothetical protein